MIVRLNFGIVNIPMLLKKIKRLDNEKHLFEAARTHTVPMSREAFYYLGLALYWSEGFKKEYSLGLVNSDPYLIKIFIQWLCAFGNVDLGDITIRVQINKIYQPYIAQVEQKWSDILSIPLLQFQKPYFQTSKRMEMYDPYYLGLVRVRARGARKFFVNTLGSIESLRQ